MKKAFTLIELVFVMIVLAILTFALWPTKQPTQALEAARQIVAHIRYTQHLALNDDKFATHKDGTSNIAKDWYKRLWRITFSSSEVDKKCNGKVFKGWDVCFSTNQLNPFLVRNQDITFPSKDKNSFRNIVSVERVDTIATQCIEVDSPSHTFLFGESLIVTHNTNRKLDEKSYFDSRTKKNQMMNMEYCLRRKMLKVGL